MLNPKKIIEDDLVQLDELIERLRQSPAVLSLLHAIQRRDRLRGNPLGWRLDDLQGPLSERVLNCLRNPVFSNGVPGLSQKIETVQDLTMVSAQELLRLRHMGQKSVSEIRTVLGDLGLSLKGETAPVSAAPPPR